MCIRDRGKDGQLHEVTINSPQDAVKYGIGYLSEDRRRYGVVVQKSVTENTTLATMEEYCNGLFINKAKEKKVTERYVKELATKTPSTDQLVVNLSGGNQQKVVIAKWLTPVSYTHLIYRIHGFHEHCKRYCFCIYQDTVSQLAAEF